jgi:hypothetical protein
MGAAQKLINVPPKRSNSVMLVHSSIVIKVDIALSALQATVNFWMILSNSAPEGI